MSESKSFTRAKAIAGTLTDVIGVRPLSARLLRRLFGSINIWFWAIVGLPSLVAGVYYFAIASDLYLSEAKFVVRSPSQGPTGAIGSFLASTGFAPAARDDTAAVEDFIMSRDAVRKLEQQNDLREVLNRPEGDFVARFPGILGRTDFEALYSRYGHFVSVETNGQTGVTTLMVKAFRPQDAQDMANALLHYSEQLINDLNARARRDALETARREVDSVSQQIAATQTAITAYRIREKMLDPKTASSGVMMLLERMSSAQADARGQLAELVKNSPNSPQIPLVKTRIASLDKLIDEERQKISGVTNSVVASMTEYERLTTDRELAEKALASAYISLEAARVQAQKQQIYLETVAQANLADYPLYPKRAVSFAIVFVSCFLVYGLAWLLFAHVREHAAA
jgi:capsular polysaccharide transport system permease protein